MKHTYIFTFIILFLVLGCKKKKSTTKAKWITETFETLESGNYPNVKAIAWWHEDFKNGLFNKSSLRIDSSPQANDAYTAGISSNTFISTPNFSSSSKLLPPTSSKIYHAAYPDFGGTEDVVTPSAIQDFESKSGKNITWAYFSNNWMDNIKFPSEAVNTIKTTGKIPFIRLMPRSNWEDTQADPKYTMQKIIDGEFDTEINQWAIDAKNVNSPLLLEFGTEVNGDWFSWNGVYNGGETKTNYGDLNKADGPERFVDAYKHIIDIFNANNVNNVTWFFHANADSSPTESWNDFENYYPGDDYIDWIGLSIYGPQNRKEDYVSFKSKLDLVYSRINTLSNNPIAILEFAISE